MEARVPSWRWIAKAYPSDRVPPDLGLNRQASGRGQALPLAVVLRCVACLRGA